MTTILAEVAIIALLALANGVFAMAEIAVVSSRRARLQHMADEGDKRATAVLKLLESPERFLSSVQVGITLIGIVAGAYGGATLSEHVAEVLLRSEFIAPYAEPIAFVLVVMLVTYLSLVLGELVPKQIAIANAERISLFMVRPVLAIMTLAKPAIWLLGGSSRAVLTALQVNPKNDQTITEEEIKIVLNQGADAGVLEKTEHSLVERVLQLGDRRTAGLMTPRTDLVWIDIHLPIGEAIRTMSTAAHTYFPVCEGGVENVLGVVSVKDLWTQLANKELPNIRNCLKPVLYVPESMPALKLLETFKQAKRHIALVVDEYGGISGLVTIHDVLEAIVGDVTESHDRESDRAVRRPDGSWLLDGGLGDDEMQQILGIDELPGDESDYQTVAGFLLAQFGRIPRPAESLEYAGYRFEVMDMDGHRIDKVLATPLPPPEDPGTDSTPVDAARATDE